MFSIDIIQNIDEDWIVNDSIIFYQQYVCISNGHVVLRCI